LKLVEEGVRRFKDSKKKKRARRKSGARKRAKG